MFQKNHRYKTTTLWIFFCIGILAGVGIARWVHFENLWFTVLMSAWTLLLFRKRNIVVLAALLLAGLLIGMQRGGTYVHHENTYKSLYKKQITFTAVASSDAVYGYNSQLSFDVQHVQVQQPYRVDLVGKVSLSGFGENMVYKGDTLKIVGKLSSTKGSAQARVSYAQITVISRSASPIDSLRRRFIAALESTLPEPQASFGAGLLIGQRSTLPKETNEQLSMTGLTHLVAVSGYNLTIIIEVSRRLLGKKSKYQGTAISFGLIVGFVLLTGFSASIVRAAIVSSLSLVAWYYGRAFRPVLLILMAAAITAIWNPFYLWSDIGWYLSFLAFFGVLVIAPVLVAMLSRRNEPKLLLLVLAETLAAQLMTIPIIMFIFGRISLIGLFANVLVVPMVPIAMLLTLIAGIAGIVVPMLSGWFAWPARLLLTYMLDITALLSKIPHALANQSIDLRYALALYAIIAFAVSGLWFKFVRKNVTVTDRIRSFDVRS